ncbi:MAG: UDP-N-acetylmuramoyl-L-alanyl-D-glutamate--2,6-diaminopimelate ligase [Gammaproteobacteria bacterium]|nr:MAG: UDP-N-acetylmuramoyl-L-alanyl-D-glutamate--2,6-diaminopimelate ligase [Gammaproteobacteria bacterium]
MKKINKILENISTDEMPDINISSISCDDREIQKLCGFFALEGASYNPLEKIEPIIKKQPAVIIWDKKNTQSAVAKVICQKNKMPFIEIDNLSKNLSKIASRFYDNPSSKLIVIGITGTDGKTSITNLLSKIIGEKQTGTIGTLGFSSDDGFISTGSTTPDAFLTQKILDKFIKQNKKYAILEVTSHAIAQHRTEAIAFNQVLLSNLGSDHLDFHKTIDEYHTIKLNWLKKVGAGRQIYNYDDLKCKENWLQDIKKNPKLKAYSVIKLDGWDNVVSLDEDVIYKHDGIILKYANEKINIHLFGEFNASNIMAAVAICLALKIEFMDKLSKLIPIIGRMQMVCPNIFVDFAHTEQALKLAILSLKQHFNQKILLVFGCGGDRDKTKRAKMGQVAEKFADFAIITDDNPRYESPQDIVSQIKAKIKNMDNFKIIHNRTNAIKTAIDYVKKNNMILLVAGKGAESMQDYGTYQIEFNDITLIKRLCQLK